MLDLILISNPGGARRRQRRSLRAIAQRTVVQLTIVVLGCTLGCATTPAPAPAPAPVGAEPGANGGGTLGQPMPDLSLPLLVGGEPLALKSLRGQVVLLDIWASWCAPCRDELPLLDELARRHQAKGVEIVAVSVDEERADVLEFLRIQPSWRLRVAHDTDQQAARALHPPKMPTSYLIDRQGRLQQVHPGFERGDTARIEAELLALARQPAP